MIQIRRARFQNFRLLRDIELEFSTDFAKPLTVVRAENDTGKTTLLNGLTWALFGDSALPGSRTAFRLHPIDWDATSDGPTVPIKVIVEFAAVDEETDAEVVYELERGSTERLVGDTDFEPSAATITLLRHTHAGVEPVDNPTAVIESLLPASLRDVFFIDGDRALAFIEATDEQRVKRSASPERSGHYSASTSSRRPSATSTTPGETPYPPLRSSVPAPTSSASSRPASASRTNRPSSKKSSRPSNSIATPPNCGTGRLTNASRTPLHQVQEPNASSASASRRPKPNSTPNASRRPRCSLPIDGC